MSRRCPVGDPVHANWPIHCGCLSDREREMIEEQLAEWEEFFSRCPYCGDLDVAAHRITHHPDMWIGGSRVYGTVWHGWADG